MAQVDFLGLAQRYAEVSSLICSGATLGEVLADIHTQCPAFAQHCPADQLLPTGLIVCVNERQFSVDPQLLISKSDRVLIMSADVGG